MIGKSVKINFLLYNIRNVVTVLLPLITFPYTSRILGPEKLGIIDYSMSIVAYFILFAALGVPNYGIRTVAGVRDDKNKLSIAVAELSVILSVCTMIVFVVYIFCFHFFSAVFEPKLLYIILGLNIFLSVFSFEWFYVGIEEQSLITKRFLLVKVLFIICLFTFVKQSSDYILYAFFSVVIGGLGTVFNIVNLRKRINFVPFHELRPLKHLVPILITFGSSIAISIYSYVDITMLGSISGTIYVGYYSAANKFITMALTLVTSLGSVILPRLSNSFENGDFDKYKINLYKSLNFTLLISLPITLGIILLGPELLEFLAGEKYKSGELTLQILACIVTIVPLAHYVGFQILYTNKKEGIYTTAVVTGAIANLITNSFLIPKFQNNGAAVGTVVAEFVGLLVMTILGFRYVTKYTTFSWKLIIYLVSTLIMGICILFVKNKIEMNVLVYILIGIITYFVSILLSLKILRRSLKEYLKTFVL